MAETASASAREVMTSEVACMGSGRETVAPS